MVNENKRMFKVVNGKVVTIPKMINNLNSKRLYYTVTVSHHHKAINSFINKYLLYNPNYLLRISLKDVHSMYVSKYGSITRQTFNKMFKANLVDLNYDQIIKKYSKGIFIIGLTFKIFNKAVIIRPVYTFVLIN